MQEKMGAHMGADGGWTMPHEFTSLLEEHFATRAACGVFDISHLAKLHITGTGCLDWLEGMLSNKVSDCPKGQGIHTLMLDERGGILDQMIVLRDGVESFWLLGSAAMAEEDYSWLQRHRPDGAIALQNETERWSGMGLYGPESTRVLARVLRGIDLPALGHFSRIVYQNCELILAHLKLWGREGYQLFTPAMVGISWYESLIGAGAIPCGFKARECLRLEQHYPAVDTELSHDKSPVQARLEHLCNCHKEKPFIGSAQVQRQQEQGTARKLAAVECSETSESPEAGQQVTNEEGSCVGSVTSGCISPSLGRGLALVYLASQVALPGTRLRLIINGRPVPAIVLP